jgi:magnesium transporter
MIQALLHQPREGFSKEVDLTKIDQLLLDKHSILWLDVQDPTPNDMSLLQREFGFHPLAIEDATSAHMRPKLDEYDGFYFLVFYSLALENDGGLKPRELDLFIGENYLVTVHKEAVEEINEARSRWESNQQSIGHGVGALLYALLDSLVDGYFGVSDTVAEQVAALEERAIRDTGRQTVEEVFGLKKPILAVRRILGPERDALNSLMRQDLPLLDRKTVVYLRDVHDHLVRITDTVDLYADLLTSLLDVHLSAVSNSLNQVVKALTSWTIILMTLALVAGIYGMNFHNIPELSWEYGYAYALGLMAATGGALYLYLRRKGWL